MFSNRTEAGQLLAKKLEQHHDAIVLGIPRGGMVVAAEVANTLKTQLHALIVRKIGSPGNEELAVGAVSLDEKPVWNTDTLRVLGLTPEDMKEKADEKIREVRQRKELFGAKKLPQLEGKMIIVVDDGIATGSSVLAALQWLKAHSPKRIILAVPCAPSDTALRMRSEVDEFVCLEESPFFGAVGQFYRDFREVKDDEVKGILEGTK
ncbi:phosphoribosyltransferase [Candidatus Micrarchaeota archaeon]|nr:phosphoribosyltransferase [Candidatus Micrarchaeota archaeon]